LDDEVRVIAIVATLLIANVVVLAVGASLVVSRDRRRRR
jgi:hypothetical protein